ncbi:polymer-forming cytoskeletal protein [Neobacillus sp. MM2021_6]|uniref:polymer-forming cytoskeletal protein n=1 Tax=Bacillaceae TaxID=186817 RepID=UPI00140C0C3C|nr:MULTISPECIES: polymer-forming cytoskeletal protein [Bacillaceae]MBO0962706.1 polymer-forming cytoskeletal protein [Neobacillus sp. MM2021_6]NHC21368.1 cytoplasmic protein [Bacillus sp. MM2020_4]
MDMKKRGDLSINGFGSANGGEFHKVIINGKGTVTNDLECVEFDCNGSGTVNGNVKTNSAKVNGTGKIKGNLECKKLIVDGTAKIGENLYVENFKVAGKTTVGGRVKAEEIRVKGRLIVEGDCEAETFKAESLFMIGGLLNADQVDIKIFGECKAKEIGGQTILIKQKPALMGLFKPLIQTQLETDLIEGDKIELENTKAAVVRGNQITIGAKCEIGLVEYTGELFVDKKAIVKESRKV